MESFDNAVNFDPSNKDCRPKFKRKNRKNKFMSNAKGFGKRGIFGRGTIIEDDQFSYFVNILDAMKTGFESVDDKVSMANNVFDQTIDKEIHLSSNQIVCKCIELLMGFTDDVHFEKFMTAFSSNFRPICSDPYASHVLQKIIEIAFLRAVGDKTEDSSEDSKKKIKLDNLTDTEYNTTEKFTDAHRAKCAEFVLKIGKFLLNNLEDFVWDQFASHIMRTSILSLAGIHAKKVAFDNKKDITQHTTLFAAPPEWTEVVNDFSTRLEMWPQFSDFPYKELSSALMGCICLALKKVDKNLLKHLGKKIMLEAFLKINHDDNNAPVKDDTEIEEKKPDEIQLAKVFESDSSIRLLETLLLVAGRKLFTQLYAMLFSGRLKILSLDRTTNFAVQKLIEKVKDKSDFETIFDELADSIEELLKVGHTGIVFSLSNGCLRFQTKQGAFVIAIQNALHTSSSTSKEKSDFYFNCLIKLKPYEITIEDKTQFIHLHGSLIIQNILKFNKPIALVNCILAQTPADLSIKFSTPNGSHIVDAYLESKFIGEKSREKLIRHLDGMYLDMAVTKSGSRVVEKLFEVAGDNQKLKIAKELSDQMNRLNGTPFGRLVSTKLRIESFKLSPNQWKEGFNRSNKAEKLFKDIIE